MPFVERVTLQLQARSAEVGLSEDTSRPKLARIPNRPRQHFVQLRLGVLDAWRVTGRRLERLHHPAHRRMAAVLHLEPVLRAASLIRAIPCVDALMSARRDVFLARDISARSEQIE